MNEDWQFTLRKVGYTTWELVSVKGFVVHTIQNCYLKAHAEERAKAWLSSWIGAGIKAVIDE